MLQRVAVCCKQVVGSSLPVDLYNMTDSFFISGTWLITTSHMTDFYVIHDTHTCFQLRDVQAVASSALPFSVSSCLAFVYSLCVM